MQLNILSTQILAFLLKSIHKIRVVSSLGSLAHSSTRFDIIVMHVWSCLDTGANKHQVHNNIIISLYFKGLWTMIASMDLDGLWDCSKALLDPCFFHNSGSVTFHADSFAYDFKVHYLEVQVSFLKEFGSRYGSSSLLAAGKWLLIFPTGLETKTRGSSDVGQLFSYQTELTCQVTWWCHTAPALDSHMSMSAEASFPEGPKWMRMNLP